MRLPGQQQLCHSDSTELTTSNSQNDLMVGIFLLLGRMATYGHLKQTVVEPEQASRLGFDLPSVCYPLS